MKSNSIKGSKFVIETDENEVKLLKKKSVEDKIVKDKGKDKIVKDKGKEKVIKEKKKEKEKNNIIQYPSSKKDYKTIEHIGRGSYGYVLLTEIISGAHKGEKVALKILDLDNYYTENWQVIEKELNLLQMISHPNLIKSLHSFVDESELHLVMPYMNGGSVLQVLNSRFRKGFKDEALLATILKQTLNAIVYLHNDSRIHRDIKAGNILLSKKGDVKLADFGVSRCLMEAGEKKGLARTFTGTPCWMAPEVMKQEKGYDYKADIWSFGITALEMAYGKPPLADHTPMKVLVMTLENKPPSTTSYGTRGNKFSKSFKNLVDICLKKDALRRPSAKELLKQKFFKKAKNNEYISEVLFKNGVPDYQGGILLNKAIIPRERKDDYTKKQAVPIGDYNFDGVEEIMNKEKNKKKNKTNKKEPQKTSRFKVKVED